MHPVIIHRVATTAIIPLTALGGWAGYGTYQHAPTHDYQPQPVCTVITSTLALGASSGQVAFLQQFLIGQGYLRGTPTGYFGQSTEDALRRFQADEGLPITGVADALTRERAQAIGCPGARQTNVSRTLPSDTYPYNSSRSHTYDYGTYDSGRYSSDYGSSYSYSSSDCDYRGRNCYDDRYGSTEHRSVGPVDGFCTNSYGRWDSSCDDSRVGYVDSYPYAHTNYDCSPYDRACSSGSYAYRW